MSAHKKTCTTVHFYPIADIDITCSNAYIALQYHRISRYLTIDELASGADVTRQALITMERGAVDESYREDWNKLARFFMSH